jgi:hypothetical protein
MYISELPNFPIFIVNSRGGKPFQEGQTYICNSCDGYRGSNKEQVTGKSVDDATLNSAILKSASSHGIDFNNAADRDCHDISFHRCHRCKACHYMGIPFDVIFYVALNY